MRNPGRLKLYPPGWERDVLDVSGMTVAGAVKCYFATREAENKVCVERQDGRKTVYHRPEKLVEVAHEVPESGADHSPLFGPGFGSLITRACAPLMRRLVDWGR